MTQICKCCGVERDIQKDFHVQAGRTRKVCKVCTRDKRRERRKRQREAKKYVPSTSTSPAKELLQLQTVADIPPTLGPIHSLEGLDLKSTDNLELKSIDGMEDLLVSLERKRRISNGK